MSRILRAVAVCLSGCLFAYAETISIVGNLNAADPNDVFLYDFSIYAPSTLTVQSWGYGGGTNAAGTMIPAGGFDAYVSLFLGTGPLATFLAADDDGGCPPAGGIVCGDPRLVRTALAAGTYTVAVTAFGNMSFAENYGSGTLGDGFTAMGSYYDWRTSTDTTSAFAIDISGEIGTVPESSYLIPLLSILAWILLRRR